MKLPEERAGLEGLARIPVPARGDKLTYPPGQVLGDFLYLSDKPGGVEPGFVAITFDDKLLKRINEDSTFLTAAGLHQPFGSVQDCKEWFRQHGTVSPSARRLIEQLLTEGKSQEISPLVTLTLIKQDYQDPSFATFSRVAPPVQRLTQTSAIQKKDPRLQPYAAQGYQLVRLTDPKNENLNAILETLATEIAKKSGMNVQEQTLLWGTYNNGRLKLLTGCKWNPKLEKIEGCLAGTPKASNYKNYLVKPVKIDGQIVKEVVNPGTDKEEKKPLLAQVDGYYLVDTSIQYLGESLALFIAQGDRDVFGSKAQNKGREGDHLFGFDFGHAYREANKVAESLQPDFSFDQHDYKNLSICTDALLSEKMMGMFYLYKMASPRMINECFSAQEQKAIQTAINQFAASNPHFAERFNKTEAGCYEATFDAYRAKFSELAMNASRESHRKEFSEYAEEVETAKGRAIDSLKTMFGKLKSNMQLGPQELDMLDGLNKLTSKTSITSEDGKVILAHLRVLPENKLIWQMNKSGEHIELQAEVKDVPGGTRARDAVKELEKYLQGQYEKLSQQQPGKAESFKYALGIKLIAAGDKVKMILPKQSEKTFQASFGFLATVLKEEEIIAAKRNTMEINPIAASIRHRFIKPELVSGKYGSSAITTTVSAPSISPGSSVPTPSASSSGNTTASSSTPIFSLDQKKEIVEPLENYLKKSEPALFSRRSLFGDMELTFKKREAVRACIGKIYDCDDQLTIQSHLETLKDFNLSIDPKGKELADYVIKSLERAETLATPLDQDWVMISSSSKPPHS